MSVVDNKFVVDDMGWKGFVFKIFEDFIYGILWIFSYFIGMGID